MASNFTFELRDSTAYNPRLLGTSLSATDNSIDVRSFGTVGGKRVVAVLYNTVTSPAAGKAILSAGNGFSIRVSTSFNTRQIALEYSDHSTSLVTLTTAFGTTTVQNVTAATNFNTEVSPYLRRLRFLGYI
jgi:hypothetical protein